MKPAIVAPAARHLSVTDSARSLVFYCDVLGFEQREARDEYGVPAIAEVVSGPARIRFTADDDVAGNAAARRILFFETDNVMAMHAAIRARNGTPTEVDSVNGIKTRMFEIRNPDAHALVRAIVRPTAHAHGLASADV